MTWQQDVASPAWQAAVTAPRRTLSYRVEAVSLEGQPLGDVPCTGVRVSYDGGQAESWRGSFALVDPTMVPVSTTSLLDGRSGTMLRIWWRILTEAGWMECSVGTLIVEDPEVTDDGTLSIGVPGLDVLSVARRGKYGASVVQVGGMTVSAALQRLFDTVAPGFPVSIAPSTATLPATYELWDRDPAEDWTEIAAMAGMVVRTDRLGTITVRPDPDPSALVADWQEGPSCPVVELKSATKTSTIPRRVVVVSTSPDVTPPVVGVWTNPDADSQTIVTEQRIESSTVTTVAAAESLARMSGERWARPQQSVQVTVPPRPDLGYRDQVALTRHQAGVSGVYRVQSWELTLSGPDEAPALMPVTMMVRQ